MCFLVKGLRYKPKDISLSERIQVQIKNVSYLRHQQKKTVKCL